MLAAIATVLGLMACVIALAAVGKRSTSPYPTLMVIAGLCIGVIPGLPEIKLNPEVVFLIFLPPILYSAAWNTWWEDFKRNIRTISLLAIGLVLFTTLGVGVVAHAVIPGMSWSGAFLLGSIVSPPDAAAATAICQRLGVSRKIVTILEGESLVNDATGLICYRFALLAINSGDFSFAQAGIDLVVAGAGGVLLGILIGWIISHIHQRLRDPAISTAISLLAPFLAYLPAELLHVSGVLA
jgi:CPA1 family monovalent cation:H+ antiporter